MIIQLYVQEPSVYRFPKQGKFHKSRLHVVNVWRSYDLICVNCYYCRPVSRQKSPFC